MADIDTSWTWNFTGPTTMSKAQSRANLPKEIAWDLIGFDGNEPGCLRTHPGFKKLDGSGGTFTVVNSASAVVGFFPVSVLTSASTFLWGYVWVERVANSGTFFYAKFHNGTSWVSPSGSSQIHSDAAAPTEFDVQVSGRNLFIFARGSTPQIIQVTIVGNAWTFTKSNVGPGAAPVAVAMTGTPTTPTGSRAPNNQADMYVSANSTGSGTTYAEGNYSFAVQYVSSTTGRKSALSNVVTVTTTATNNKIDLNVIRITSDYDRALIYRSVNLGSGSGSTTYGNGTLHLEKVVTLSSGSAQSYAVSVTDTQLPYQDIYVDKGKSDTYGPKGGVAAFMGSTLFVSRISDTTAGAGAPSGNFTPDNPPRALGELRWSSTGEMQPENFNPSSRWIPKTPGHEILAMRQVGNYMIGLGADRIYRIGRAGAFIKVEEGHVGYGLVGKQALENVGTMVYFVAGGGLKAVGMDGQVEDVTAFDYLTNVTWAATKSTLQLSYDAVGQCLTMLMPSGLENAGGRAALLWFGTNRTTELVDLPFIFMRSGSVYSNGQLQRRSLFVKQESNTTMGVYIVDHERSRVVADPRTDSYNLCGGTYLTNGGSGDACQYWYFDELGNGLPAAIAPSAFGCAAYNVVTGERTTVNSLFAAVTAEPGDFANTTWSIAPIYQQWVGGNIGMQIQPGDPEFKDFFRQKQISSCRSYYEVVSTPEPRDINDPQADYFPAEIAAWEAIAYKGAETDIYSTAKPLQHNGQVMSAFTLPVNDPGLRNPGMIANAPFGRHGVLWSSLSPGWRCYLTGVDVRLLAFSAVGRILDSDRRYT